MPRDVQDEAHRQGRPDFVCIVGAPRCGTTTLAGFLQDHPDVCFSSVKEPHYFSRVDLSELSEDQQRHAVENEYLARYFPHRRDGMPLAEGSVSYLYAPERMAPMLARWPNAKFVIALRDPLTMIPSLHQRLLYTGDETVADFEKAWSLRYERMRGRGVPASCIDPRMLQYEEAGRLGAYVEAFFRVVGRERCFVVLFDDLSASPAAVYDALLAFLNLAPHPRADFEPKRASRGFRNAWLQRLLKRPPVATRLLLAGAEYRKRIQRLDRPCATPPWVKAIQSVRMALLRWNRAPAPSARLSPMVRAQICRALADDVFRLSALIGRDLSHWLDGALRPAAIRDAPIIIGGRRFGRTGGFLVEPRGVEPLTSSLRTRRSTN